MLKLTLGEFGYTTIFFVAASSLFANPVPKEVVAGQALFDCPDLQTMTITTSDKAIINYHQFNIGEQESVYFVQPSSKSCVLNRIVDGDPSRILGEMRGNGRVFLVNPMGIYFGKEAKVNIGSFVASTLNILDDDFLSENYRFYLEKGHEQSSIVNEGLIAAQPEGFIGIFSPVIQNRGSIIASAERILLGSGEKIALDFAGDGLVQFSVEGDLKNALIENYGQIESANGDLKISMRAAQKAIHSVVNMDGIVPATEMKEIDGCVCLISRSSLIGKNIEIDAPAIESTASTILADQDLRMTASGPLKLRDQLDQENLVKAGRYLTMEGDQIDILTLSHPSSRIVSGADLHLVSAHPISADAHFSSGGKFSLLKPDGTPADFISLVDPIVSATGSVTFGSYSGVSLKVESTQRIICSGTINITGPDLSAPADSQQAILTGFSALILNSGTTLEHPNNIPVTYSGTLFDSDVSSGTDISLGGNVTWNGTGRVILAGNVTLTSSVTIQPNSGDYPGDVTIVGTVNGSSAASQSFAIQANGGLSSTVSVGGAIGATTSLSSLTLSASGALSCAAVGGASVGVSGTTTMGSATNLTLTGVIYRTTGVQNYGSAGNNIYVSPGVTSTFSTVNNNITFNSDATIHSTSNGAILNISAGTAAISIGGIGSAIDEFNSVALTAGTSISVYKNIMAAQQVQITGPLLLAESVVFTTNAVAGGITISGTIDSFSLLSPKALSLQAGTGTVTVGGDIAPQGTPITALTINAGTVFLKGIGIFGISGVTDPMTITSSGDITFTGGYYTTTGSASYVTGSGKSFYFNPNGTVNFASSNALISFTNGTMRSTTGLSNVTFSSGSGGLTIPAMGIALGEFGTTTFTTSGILSTNGAIYTNTLSPGFASQNKIGGSIQTNNTALTFTNTVSLTATPIVLRTGALTFNNTLNGDGTVLNPNLTIIAGAGASAVTFNNTIGATNSLGPLSVSGSTITVANNITTNGLITLTGNVVRKTGVAAATFNSNGNAISITGNLNGTAANAQSLTITAGAGSVSIGGSTGASVSLKALSITAGSISMGNIGTSGAGGVNDAMTLTSANDFTFTGTNYRTNNTATYVAGAGKSFNIGAGSTVSFIAQNFAIAFTNGVMRSSGASTVTFNPGSAAITIPAMGTLLGEFGTTTISSTGAVSTGGAIYTNTLTFSSAPSQINIGGSIITNNTPVTFSSPVRLTASSITLSTGGLVFSNTLDGDGVTPYPSLTIAAGSGAVTFANTIGATYPLNDLTISGGTVTWNSIATGQIMGDLAVTSNAAINFNGASYLSGGSQTYSASTNFNMNAASTTSFETNGAAINFTSGAILLVDGSNLQIQTNNGNFSFASLTGTSSENVTIDVGSGTATLGAVTGLNTIDLFHVDAGTIRLSGAMVVGSLDLLSLGAISNTGSSVAITTTNGNATFDAGGNIGSISSPVQINSTGLITAGWEDLAVINGTSSDMTVHELPLSLCCKLIFNSTVVHDCHPPTPEPTPSPIVIIPVTAIATSAVFSSTNFYPGSNYFFLPNSLNSNSLSREVVLFQKVKKHSK